MKNKICVLIILTMVCSDILSAQNYILYGDKTFGTSKGESDVKLLKFSDNQLLLSGKTNANIDGDKTDSLCNGTLPNNIDLWILKTDTSNNIIWNKSYGGEKIEARPDIYINTNGTLILASESNSDSACEKSENSHNSNFDYWICAIDSNGTKLWDKTFGGGSAESNPILMQLSGGNYLITGLSESPIGFDKSVANYGGFDYWTVKFDSVGNKIWDNVYGGLGSETAVGINNQGFSLVADNYDSFILAGRTNSSISGNISVNGYGSFDIWVIKVDSLGNKIWDNRFGGSSTEELGQIIKTTDGYMIVGSTSSPLSGNISDPPIGNYDIWIIKLDSLGNKLWDRRYGGIANDLGHTIAPSFDGGYLVCGTTQSQAGFDISESPFGMQDYWIFKIDSLGNKLWDKRYGGPGNNVVSNFLIMPDTSIFLFGTADSGTSAVKTDAGKGSKDYWLVHFKYSDSGVGIEEISTSNNFFTLTPNLSNGSSMLKSNYIGKCNLTVYNLHGQNISTEMVFLQSQNNLNFSYLTQGLYFLRISNENFSEVIRFIRQ